MCNALNSSVPCFHYFGFLMLLIKNGISNDFDYFGFLKVWTLMFLLKFGFAMVWITLDF